MHPPPDRCQYRDKGTVDDLGHPVDLLRPPRRVVSLVPSLTEALAVTVPERLVGATDWCTHPAGLDVARVRGTKNPDRAAVAALAPDLVVANREENRRLDVERLRAAGVPVWVTVIESVDEALTSMRRLFGEVLDVGEPAWLAEAAAAWSQPPPATALRVAVPVWRDPWMVVGPRTFTGDVLARLGLVNVFADAEDRYPKVDLPEIATAGPDVVVLPDEPYPFTADDGPEAFPGTRTALVSGRDLTWYGPSLGPARARLLAATRG
ncbi:helical backbone metal receptor [Geodermatophilus sp. DSM 45219]|uniref:helical backbone metal receptor n=1 Tax=Geodermatophilus sp. DSM 45219 TaxID=1881103 RepID=UPI0008841C88|nr:helical backbone metal receptor [Geodermatophilus sp. DSM 45219]SDN79899.1 substrate-binding protein [Geodermatophilus sp. DSM 45219]